MTEKERETMMGVVILAFDTFDNLAERAEEMVRNYHNNCDPSNPCWDDCSSNWRDEWREILWPVWAAAFHEGAKAASTSCGMAPDEVLRGLETEFRGLGYIGRSDDKSG